MTAEIVLEPAVRAFLDAPPPAFADPDTHADVADDARVVLDSVAVRIVRPRDVGGPLPVVLYLHGGGVGAHTPDRLVRELAERTGAAVLIPECSPDAAYPIALEQAYAAAKWVADSGTEHGLDSTRMAVAGDSIGGNYAIALSLLAVERGDFALQQLVAICPATDPSCGSASHRMFAEGFHLRRRDMLTFWEHYAPDATDLATVSPLRASENQLAGCPPALVITAEADVLRDEGEQFADLLRAAGVPTTAVRYEGTIHGFVTLDALAHTNAATAATAQASAALRYALAEAQTR
ncbi:alpha/beta hydrolase [Rhodococcoides yunnanense]|uniref:alpha/beta hydrolase n=1 Tax=Rhodococcoides yunnanense TaxID=278209 RepID=UPI000934F2C1|nr:alpha/beta hydrolase [Rhodococcus yunnanensis]